MQIAGCVCVCMEMTAAEGLALSLCSPKHGGSITAVISHQTKAHPEEGKDDEEVCLHHSTVREREGLNEAPAKDMSGGRQQSILTDGGDGLQCV